jgi:hypothetical protein
VYISLISSGTLIHLSIDSNLIVAQAIRYDIEKDKGASDNPVASKEYTERV